MKFYKLYIGDNICIHMYLSYIYDKIIKFIFPSQQRVFSLQSQLSVHPFFDAH